MLITNRTPTQAPRPKKSAPQASTTSLPKGPASPGPIQPARDIPLVPLASTGLGAISGALLGRSAVATAVGAAIGAGVGVVGHNLARWMTPEGPRLIVGHTGADEARIWGRGDKKSPVMFVEVKNQQGQVAFEGRQRLKSDDGYTGIVEATDLEPGQSYKVKVSYGKTEEAKPEDRRHSEEGGFRTTDPNSDEVSFFLGSCNNHRFWRRNESWQRIGNLAEQKDPDFVLQTGDQIYADQPLQTYQLGGFRGSYRRAWSSPEAKSILKDRANYMILDDHEIGNDFGEDAKLGKFRRSWLLARGLFGNEAAQRKTLEVNGLKAYMEYQHSHNPQTFEADKLYYSFSRGENQFFVMDARSERDPDQGQMISPLQMDRLKGWLTENPEQPKFLVSSVPFLAEKTEQSEDAIWSSQAFRSQRNEILDFVAEQGIKGVCILSGDSHTSFHIESELSRADGQKVAIHELSASPINGFWVHDIDTWQTEHQETTGGGNQFGLKLDKHNFVGASSHLSRDASSVMSVRSKAGKVEFEIHRTHRDEAEPVGKGSFDLGLIAR